MPTISPKSVMSRAWKLMTDRHRWQPNGKGVPFKSIGRACFASCLRRAWAELKAEAAEAAMTAEQRAERVAKLRNELVWLDHASSFHSNDNLRRCAIYDELRRLAA